MSVFESPDHMAFSCADDANVPVDIWLHAPDEECDKWQLTAANYMPRKACLHPHGYRQTADTREELVALLTAYVLPLYRIAMAKIEGIVAGTEDHLYYWNGEPTLEGTEPPPPPAIGRCGTCKHFYPNANEAGWAECLTHVNTDGWRAKVTIPADGSGFCHLHDPKDGH